MSRKLWTVLCLALAIAAGVSRPARAGLLAGDVAVIGWIDNGTPDSFAFVTLAPVAAGESIYFTDNGWTGTQFRSPASNDGDGNETLAKWTSVSAISPGTIIRSNATDPSYAWTLSGAVPGGVSGAFAPLSIGNPAEQIYAFQGASSLPLQNVTSQLFVLDDTGAFENAIDSETGAIPPGLSLLDHTAVTLPASFGAQRFIKFNTDTLASGTKAEWLTAIANPANWTAAASGTLPTGQISVVPEPATWAMCASGLLGWIVIRLRKRG